MKNNPVTIFLEKLDLDTKEIKAYLYCLENGPQLISRLAQVIGSTRTNAYDTVKKLEEKGLAHMLGSNYGRQVKANNPEDIRNLLQHKTQKIKSLEKELDDIIPLLKNNTNSLSPFTRVSYFEGPENIRKMIWQSLQSKEKIIKIAGSELDIAESLGEEFLVDYHNKRKDKKIKLKALRPDSKKLTGIEFNNDASYFREIKIRPNEKVRLKSNMIIWDNFVALYSLKNKVVFGTLIESEDMAIMMSSWFDVIWEQSTKIKNT